MRLAQRRKTTHFQRNHARGCERELSFLHHPEPNVGVVAVPDERLDKLAALYQSKKITPAVIEFVDIAGLVKGASHGEGLGNKFLSHIREVDAIVHVVRCFEDANITHVENSVDPVRDIQTINLELILSDMETVRRA